MRSKRIGDWSCKRLQTEGFVEGVSKIKGPERAQADGRMVQRIHRLWYTRHSWKIIFVWLRGCGTSHQVGFKVTTSNKGADIWLYPLISKMGFLHAFNMASDKKNIHKGTAAGFFHTVGKRLQLQLWKQVGDSNKIGRIIASKMKYWPRFVRWWIVCELHITGETVADTGRKIARHVKLSSMSRHRQTFRKCFSLVRSDATSMMSTFSK